MYPWVKLLIYHITHSPKLPISVIFPYLLNQMIKSPTNHKSPPIWSDLQYFVSKPASLYFSCWNTKWDKLDKWKRKSFKPHKKFLWLACYIPRLKTYTVIAETGSVNESFFSVSFKFNQFDALHKMDRIILLEWSESKLNSFQTDFELTAYWGKWKVQSVPHRKLKERLIKISHLLFINSFISLKWLQCSKVSLEACSTSNNSFEWLVFTFFKEWLAWDKNADF